MKKIRTKNGLIAYEVTLSEVTLLGGFGICDECNEAPHGGYLVPVLNHYQCEKCFNDFSKRARSYPQDEWVEEKNAAYFESVIPITEWPQECRDCPCADASGKCEEIDLDGLPVCECLGYDEFEDFMEAQDERTK